MADPSVGVEDDVADGELQPAAAAYSPDDGQTPVGRPVGEFDVVEKRSWRTPGDRHLGQRSALAQVADDMAPERDGKLSVAGDGEKVGAFSDLEVARFGGIRANREDRHRLAG